MFTIDKFDAIYRYDVFKQFYCGCSYVPTAIIQVFVKGFEREVTVREF